MQGSATRPEAGLHGAQEYLIFFRCSSRTAHTVSS